MIIPYGHESQKLRRIPWVSFIIMGACVIIHISVSAAMDRVEKKLQTALYNLFQYYFAHTYLELNPEIKKLFNIDNQFEEALEKRDELFGPGKKPPADDIIEEEQQESDRLSQKLLDTIEEIPFKKWGFIPVKKSILTLFTYMFIHGGWLHLIGNLLLIYLSAPFIEDIWGKPVFLAMYIVTGMMAGQMFAVHYPNFAGPLIGASGAASAVMGAFLVKFWRTKIKFFFWIFIVAGTFRAPAWLMVPLWVILEFYSAKAVDSLKIPGGGGVAHWVHVWGFIFGVASALALKYTGIEEKYLAPKIKAKVSFEDESFKVYEEAMEHIDNGRQNAAFDRLLEGARQYPTNQEIIELLWHLGIELGRREETQSYYLNLVENELRLKKFDLALYHYGQLKELNTGISLSDQSKIILIDYLITQNELPEAEELTGELAGKMNLGSPAGFLLQLYDVAHRLEFAKIGKDTGPSPARKIIELSLQHPDIPESKKEELRAALNKIPRRAEAVEQEQKQVAAQRTINVTRVVPIGFKDSKILLDIENVGRRIFSLDKIAAISTAKIINPGGKPYFLIDLFVDDPRTAANFIRTIRMFTPQINLQQFFPDVQDRLTAFRMFISALFKLSGAKPYPDLESVQLQKVITFSNITEYDNSLKR